MLAAGPSSKSNGLIRCYNMFPPNFRNIEEMTDHLTQVKALGMNVVWINPIQLAGKFVNEKADQLTGQQQDLKGSLYAMADHSMIDPRFSVVNRDNDGDMALSPEQMEQIKELDANTLLRQIKALRNEIKGIEELLRKRILEIGRLERSLASRKNPGSDSFNTQLQLANVNNAKLILDALLKTKHAEFKSLVELQNKGIRHLDTIAIKAFTKRAKELGITPIFDLVFNHLAIDAEYIQQNRDLFNFEDRTFIDATAFAYSSLLGSRRSKDLPADKRQQIIAQIPTIIDRFWRPYIHKYVNEWGFCGARVDCVKKVPHQLREPVYQLIREGVAQQKDPAPVVIIEEALFSDLSPKEFVETVKGANATHSTGSVYYQQRQWHGGLPFDYSHEDAYKKSMVQTGVINFSGNHDHYTCAMTVCRDLAFERLQANTELYTVYLAKLAEKEQESQKELADTAIENIRSIFIHFYVKQIINELNNPDTYNDTVNRFGKAYRDKLLTSVFSGSGGYYMICGDEHASLVQPVVFVRENGEQVYPQKQMALFDPRSSICEVAEVAHLVVRAMAIDFIKGKKHNNQFSQLNDQNKEKYLSAFIEQIKNEINANVNKTKQRFIERLSRALKFIGINLDDAMLKEVSLPLTSVNGWGAPKSLERFATVEFFQEINQIIAMLPPSKTGYWSELFKTSNDDVLIAVRVNGFGYDANVDVVIHNINPDKLISIEKKDLEKIGLWLQKRGFPQVNPQVLQNPDYHKSYACIMGSSQFNLKPANLYFAGKLLLEADVHEHSIDFNGNEKGFNIVVSPRPLKQDPLFPVQPTEFVPERYSEQQIQLMFNYLKLQKKSGLSTVTETEKVKTNVKPMNHY